MPTKGRRSLLPARLAFRTLGSVSLGHIGYWAAALVIVLMGWTLFVATRDAREAESLIVHTMEVLQQVGRVDESIARADAEQRGFILNPVPRFSVERDRALAELSLGLSALRSLTADNPRQGPRIDALEEAVTQRIAVMHENAEARASQGARFTVGPNLGRGQALSAKIHALNEEMKREERGLLDQRRAAAARQYDMVWMILVAAVLVSALVMVPGYIGYMAEVHRRESAEKKLLDLADSLPGATYQLRTYPDGRQKFEFLSPGVERLRNVSREAALKDFRAMWETIVEEDRPAMTEVMESSVRDLKPVQYDFRVKQPGGEKRWLRASASLRKEADGSVLWNGYWSDITRQKQLEGELNEAREAADSASRAKSTFLATMSHEIRTPMNGVLGMLELLSLTKLDGEQRTTLAIVRESGRSLLRIIDDILDFSKIEAGKLELRPEAASIPALVERVRNIYSGNASSKGLVLKSYVDPRVGPVVVDPLRLQQILNNFVSNAIKFTSEGEVAIRVDLVERRGDSEILRFKVDDTGIGIAPGEKERLFSPFMQAGDDSAHRYGGTGLGLSICRRLAALMGGSVNIDSAVGVGTSAVLHLTLPIADAHPPRAAGEIDAKAAPAAARRAPPGIEEAGREGTLILIVDDHPINRVVLMKQVNALGYAADDAQNGLEALEKWNSGMFGAVITDCNMPELDGYQLARHIRACEAKNGHRRTPIIACTANALGGEAQNCYAAGMDDYIAKPISLGQLAKRLDQWLPIPGGGAREAHRAIDPAVLKQVSDGDVALEREILQRFRSSSADDALHLERAVHDADLLEVKHAAHRMKGASLAVGAAGLATACDRIERAARSADAVAVGEEMRSFHRELSRLEAHLAAAEATAR
jgi:PAS domain S-box-containing protein